MHLNHYPLGTKRSYVLKVDLGRAVHTDVALGMDYRVERNWCIDEDRSVPSLSDRVAAKLAALSRDAFLAQLNEQAVALRHARLATLMQQVAKTPPA